MNKKRNVIKLILCIAISIWYGALIAQKSNIYFENAELQEVIKVLEQQSDYVFNYDPALLKRYYFTGTINTDLPQEYLAQILYQSPFRYEVDAQTFLIYEPDPEEYRICGIVRDAQNKQPLSFTNIFVDDTNTGFQSNEKGFFDFTVIAPKNQSISISYIGYQTRSFMVQDLIQNSCPDYLLLVDNQMWNEEIIVTDYILDGITEGEKYSGYNLNYQQLSKFHANIEYDILKTAQLMPGITSLDESATNLQIRGSTPDQNLIMWEGATIYHSGHLFGMISAINPFSVNEVNIYKGAYDPQYDNRVGGIVDISLTDSLKTKFHGSGGSTLTEAHLNLEVPVVPNKLSVLLSGRHSINQIYKSPTLESYSNRVFQFSKIDDQSEDSEEGFINTDQLLKFHDWNAKVLFRPSEQFLVKAGIYKNYHRFEYDFSFPEDPFNTSDRIIVYTDAIHANFDWKVSEKWISSLSFLRSTYSNENDYEEEENGLLLTDYAQFNDIIDQTFTLSTTYNFSSKLNFNSGYDYNIKQVNFSLEEKFLDVLNYEDTNFDEGLFHNFFASANYNHRKLSINGGIRMTYNVKQKEWVNSPRVNFQYAISKDFKLKAEGGIFYQFISQLREYGGNALQVQNPLWIINSSGTESSQKARKLATGFIFHSKGWLIDLETYYNRSTGLSTFSPLFNQLTTDNFALGNSNAKGIDLLIKKRLRPFNIWVNYSFSRITNLFPEISDEAFFAPNDIRHNGSIVGSYQYKDFHFSLSGKYHSGLPYSRPNGIIDYWDEEDETTYYDIDFRNVNNDRLIQYLRLDLGVNYRPTFKKHDNLKLEVSVSMINLLNRENVFAREYYLDFRDDSDTPKLAFINKVLLGRTPLLLVRFYW